MKPQGFDKEFVVIGENLHATRVLLRPGKHVVDAPSGEEAIRYTSASGEIRYLVIPEEIKRRQDYQEGRVKHVAVAVRAAMSNAEPAASEGREYLRTLAERQIKTGADFLDLNVDEVSLRHREQLAAMCWLVRFHRRSVAHSPFHRLLEYRHDSRRSRGLRGQGGASHAEFGVARTAGGAGSGQRRKACR